MYFLFSTRPVHLILLACFPKVGLRDLHAVCVSVRPPAYRCKATAR
jgi:hypothetical protein